MYCKEGMYLHMFGYDIYDFVESTRKGCYVFEKKWFINRMTKNIDM